MREFKFLKRDKETGAYIIPAVFHIFGTNFNGKTVTDKIVKDALKRIRKFSIMKTKREE